MKILNQIIVLTITIIFLFISPVLLKDSNLFAQISVESRLDKSEITVGTQVKYSIIVNHSPDIKVTMPDLAINIILPIEIRDYNTPGPVEIDGSVSEQVDYIITSFRTGTYPVYPVKITYMGPDSVSRTMTTDSLSLKIVPTLSSEADDIKDIKDPLEIPINYKFYIITGSIAILILVVTLFIAYYIRKKRQGKPLIPKKEIPPVPPHELAFMELTELENSDLIAENRIKEFYSTASEIIRKYFENRYFFLAMEMITFEIMDKLKDTDIKETPENITGELLTEADLVKFAKHIPDTQSVNSVISRARDIVEATKIALIAQSVAPEIVNMDKNNDEPDSKLIAETAEVQDNKDKEAKE